LSSTDLGRKDKTPVLRHREPRVLPDVDQALALRASWRVAEQRVPHNTVVPLDLDEGTALETHEGGASRLVDVETHALDQFLQRHVGILCQPLPRRDAGARSSARTASGPKSIGVTPDCRTMRA
jgi:hypothetical protein